MAKTQTLSLPSGSCYSNGEKIDSKLVEDRHRARGVVQLEERLPNVLGAPGFNFPAWHQPGVFN